MVDWSIETGSNSKSFKCAKTFVWYWYMTLWDTFVWYTCVINLWNSFVWYLCVIYLCDTFVWYICVIHLCETFMSTFVWYIRVLSSVWYLCVKHLYGTFVWNICVTLIFQLFVVEVVANSIRLSDDNIYCQLKRCVQMAEEGEKNAEALGILTAAPRNTWAAARLRLLEGKRCWYPKIILTCGHGAYNYMALYEIRVLVINERSCWVGLIFP